MNIFKKTLTDLNACKEAVKYFEKNELEGKSVKAYVKKALKDKHWDWCNWLLPRLMTHENQVRYAIFAAEQVIGIFEKSYPDDNRPRKAIEAAKTCLVEPSKKNKDAAFAAASAAFAAASVAAYVDVAEAAAYAAFAAANAASAAAYVAEAAAYVAFAASAAMKIKIINYGLKILEGE